MTKEIHGSHNLQQRGEAFAKFRELHNLRVFDQVKDLNSLTAD